jgi:diguanylate cyclase (GGDEF)-like protein
MATENQSASDAMTMADRANTPEVTLKVQMSTAATSDLNAKPRSTAGKRALFTLMAIVMTFISLAVAVNYKVVAINLSATQFAAETLIVIGFAIWIALALSYAMIKHLSRQRKELSYRARHDPLTGMLNREHFYECLADILKETGGNSSAWSLLVLDLDRFKEVNDTLSHRFGDELLQTIAARIAEASPDAELRSRLGGDEFAILAREDGHGAVMVARQIQSMLETPIILDKIEIDIHSSIGIASYPEDLVTAHEFFRRAEVAMYHSKRRGMGLAVYSTVLDPYNKRRLALLGELRGAIEDQQLLLHYQPKVDLTMNRTLGVEALLRWKHPEHGLISPGEFIQLAEQSDLIRNLTYWVMDEALYQCHIWRQMGYMLNVAVNLSPRNLHDPGLPVKLGGLLAKWAVPADSLTLEITENAIMFDPERALKILVRLHDMGIHLSIDDFGTGYSSLVYLKKLPVSQIKVDCSFVMNMIQDPDDAVIVQSTIDLGHNLECQVVAEGVENIETLERLRGLGCDQAQGYCLSRPLPADDITSWFAQSQWGAPMVRGTPVVPRGPLDPPPQQAFS